MKLTRERVRAIQRAQRDGMPREDLRPYAGQWVAIRKGRVVAANPDVKALVADPRFGPDDTLWPVQEDFDAPLIV